MLDRTVRTDLPDDTYTTMAYGFGSDRNGLTQFMTTVWDANGHKKESYRDVRELITTVNEFNGGQTIQTSYVYDPLKQITKVIDDRGNETHVYYDNLGRRTIIDNADTGRTETKYDTAGNVIQKITANLEGAGQERGVRLRPQPPHRHHLSDVPGQQRQLHLRREPATHTTGQGASPPWCMPPAWKRATTASSAKPSRRTSAARAATAASRPMPTSPVRSPTAAPLPPHCTAARKTCTTSSTTTSTRRCTSPSTCTTPSAACSA